MGRRLPESFPLVFASIPKNRENLVEIPFDPQRNECPFPAPERPGYPVRLRGMTPRRRIRANASATPFAVRAAGDASSRRAAA